VPDLELLQQADVILGKCGGRPVLPDGLTVVPIQKSFLMPMVLTAGKSTVYTKEITGDARWALRAISSDAGSNGVTGVRIQIQLPNGRFLIGLNGQDVGQFAWVGSWRYAFDPEVEVDPGTKIQVTLTDTVGLGSDFVLNLLFEGCYKYYLKGGQRVEPGPSVARSPRAQGRINENILAPCYLLGEGPTIPEGFDDQTFTYSSELATLTIGGQLFSTLKLGIDTGYDFQLMRLLFDQQVDNTVTAGVVVARVRAGAGYALNDDFLDIWRYLNGAVAPHYWKVRGSDAIFVDLQLLDAAGAGDVTVQVHAEGIRRRKL
jgi:hypothetical protein